MLLRTCRFTCTDEIFGNYTVWQLHSDVNRDQLLSACTLLRDAEDPSLPMRLARAASLALR